MEAISEINNQNYKLLLNSKKTNKLSHAYLVECKNNNLTREIYKYISKLILCQNFEIEHHDNCDICGKIENDLYTELEIIETEIGSYKIGQLRQLQSDMSKKSIYNRPKVYVILEAEKTLEKGSNSLLKFIEEPQDNVYAILMTDNIYKIIKTIRSRCQIIKFYEKENLIETLNDKKYELQLDRSFEFLMGLCINNYIAKCEEYTKKESSEYYYTFFELMILILNIIMKKKIGIYFEYPQEYEEIFKKIESYYSIEKIKKTIKYLNNTKNLIRQNINISLLLDRTIIELGGNDE